MSNDKNLRERVESLEKAVAALQETVRLLQAAQTVSVPKPDLRSRGMLDRPKAR